MKIGSSSKTTFNNIYLIAIIVATLFMSIGYATINSVTLDIDGSANAFASKGLFIYEVVIDNNSPGNVYDSNISIMYGTMMQSKVVLNNNVNSTLSMSITIYNKSNDDVYYDNVTYGDNFYDNNNIDFTISGLTHGQKLSKNDNVTFTMTFKYTDSYKASNPSSFANILNSYIKFVFKKGYSITYNNISGTSNYTSLVMEGENLNVTFVGDVPDDITVVGSSSNTTYVNGIDYSYTNGVLTFNNVPEALIITKVSNTITGSGTQEDPYINPGPSQYDPDDVDTGTTVVFTNVDGDPKVTKDDDGNVVSFEYTDASSTNPVVFENGDSLETGIIAMDGGPFTVHIKFKADLSQNNGKFVMAALQYTASNDTYDGFSLFDYNSGYLRVGTYKNRKRSNSTGLLNANNYSTYNSTAITGEHIFDVTITYDPNGYNNRYGQIAFTTSVDGGTATTKYIRNTKAPGSASNVVPETLTNAVITIGGNGDNSSDDINHMEVIEFSVTKG